MTPITVVIPVGPHPDYKKYLPECLESVQEQLKYGDQLIVIDDQAHLDLYYTIDPDNNKVWKTPWLLGCAASWNCGVGLSRNDLVLLMGSDDRLLPNCLDSLRKAYEENKGKAAWYNLTIQIENETHSVFNNAAAITKKLWKELGGFPPSAGVGGPDSLAISIMIVHFPDRLIQVREGYPLYWCRVHSAQETPRSAGFFSSEIVSIRDKETARWTKPEWTQNL